ncbi:MAG: aminopeptidase [Gammaproteobacteria bacterium]|nr:aminopeptidase [Gammaproteobacteria bacterium]
MRIERACCALLILLAGCETVSFYQQAAKGQMQLASQGRSVADLIAADDTDHRLRRQLVEISAVLGFAQASLGLPVGGRYEEYVALDRPYVMWNLFAAPEFSTRGHEWCYPIAGCATYRGYFDRPHADRIARRLRARTFDVAVLGVPAYSTLGWFDDPLLSTFVGWPDAAVAALLIHELSHSRNFVAGDATFNESYATFVEFEGLRAWLASRGREAELAALRNQHRVRERFTSFLLQWRAVFDDLYGQPYHRSRCVCSRRRCLAR